MDKKQRNMDTPFNIIFLNHNNKMHLICLRVFSKKTCIRENIVYKLSPPATIKEEI